MSAAEESDEPALSHGNLLADIDGSLSNTSIPVWPFPTFETSRASPSVSLEEPSSASPVFTQRSASRPTQELESCPGTSNPHQSSLFSTPTRSIFSSGPPTTSVSASTAHAMSNPQAVVSCGPLSALATSSLSNKRRSVHYQIDESSVRNNQILRPEKENDDPSTPLERSRNTERRESGTPTALTHLFTTAEPETPTISRHASYVRTSNGMAYTRGT